MAKSSKQKPVTKIEIVDEPEIQYAATSELFDEIRIWLAERGAVPKKSERDSALYFDTNNFRLLREGIEYRIKEKGGQFRHDMKTPADTNQREVRPDENNILHRKEMKFKTPAEAPSLKAFFGQSLLEPVVGRVFRFFDKELEQKFRSSFFKEKTDIDTKCGDARVEYSFQTGHMETPDGKKKSKLLHILELELREGMEEGLLKEKAELERIFVPKGLKLLEMRKVMLGFELLEPTMTEKQRHAYHDAKSRNTSLVQENPKPELPLAA